MSPGYWAGSNRGPAELCSGGYTNISLQSIGDRPEKMEESYQPGSEADFDRLYRNTYRRILGTLITLMRDRSAAEDCAQETYERAYRNWASWKPDAAPEAWLHRIAI